MDTSFGTSFYFALQPLQIASKDLAQEVEGEHPMQISYIPHGLVTMQTFLLLFDFSSHFQKEHFNFKMSNVPFENYFWPKEFSEYPST